jgi:hypothetical protein
VLLVCVDLAAEQSCFLAQLGVVRPHGQRLLQVVLGFVETVQRAEGLDDKEKKKN